MYWSQATYRQLHDQLLEYESGDAQRDLLRPWIRENVEEIRWLTSVGVTRQGQWLDLDDESLCRLYGLSRVSDLLLLRFQEGSTYGSTWRGPNITIGQFVEFMVSIGARAWTPQRFHPFYCEILTVEQLWRDDAPIDLHDVVWPAILIGDLLLARAGCAVRGGSHNIVKEVAEHSKLYWAYRRKSRSHEDLSDGWGGNSQWRTDFRRDYVCHGKYHYNVDGSVAVTQRKRSAFYPLTVEQKIELLTHRCFIKSQLQDAEVWPWDYVYSEDA